MARAKIQTKAKQDEMRLPDCPAVKMARLIGAAGQEFEQLEDVDKRAADISDHRVKAGIEALAVTKATSLAGAVAKVFFAYSLVENEIESDVSGEAMERDREHKLFLAASMMADARRIFEQHVGKLSDLGLSRYHAEYAEPEAIVQQALAETGPIHGDDAEHPEEGLLAA
jgi:hypothetical protein